MLITKFINKDTSKEITIESPYLILCNATKKTSHAKKTTPHKLEKQITDISNSCGDMSPAGLLEKKLKQEYYENKRLRFRKKIK